MQFNGSAKKGADSRTTVKLGFTKVEFIQSGRILNELSEFLDGVLYDVGVDLDAVVDAAGAEHQPHQRAEVARAGADVQEREPRPQLQSF